MLIFVVSGLILLIDQLSKFSICNNLTNASSIPILKNIFHLTLVQNKGTCFGLFPHQTFFFASISVLVVGLILFFYGRLKTSILSLRVGLALILGGALGNLIDRLRFGFVVDFLDFRIWPVFNFADVSICVGAGLLILQLARRR